MPLRARAISACATVSGTNRVALKAAKIAALPTAQGQDLDIDLLPRGEIDIRLLVDILAKALGSDVITPGRNIAIDSAAILGLATHRGGRDRISLRRYLQGRKIRSNGWEIPGMSV